MRLLCGAGLSGHVLRRTLCTNIGTVCAVPRVLLVLRVWVRLDLVVALWRVSRLCHGVVHQALLQRCQHRLVVHRWLAGPLPQRFAPKAPKDKAAKP